MAGVMPIVLGSGINRDNVQLSISSNTSNYTLNTAKVTGYNAGKTDVTLTIDAGVYISSSSTGSYAFTVDNSWAAGDTITIINNGTIIGRGGNGGNGTQSGPGGSGGTAGPALYVQRTTSINNVNRISGGGGGGGAGGGTWSICQKQYGKQSAYFGLDGPGGAGGIGVSSPGNIPSNPCGTYPSYTGQAGTLTSAGTGASVPGGQGLGPSGPGGSYGSSGSAGSPGAAPAGGGGGAGACVVGNTYITWIATGTRNGSIS